VKQRAETLKLIRMKLQKLWDQAQRNLKKYYDKHYIDKHFVLDKWVLLSTKNIYFKISKLAPKFIGPFKITECIKEAAYRLKLLSIYDRLHNVFNVNLLKEYHIQKGKEPELYNKEELPKLAENDEDQK
jgi:hypothetical protein